ncbi:MAG: GH3 auxin-responsive promoter family protein [Cytophagaceae bacterium]|jgi:hypothetical protein|nr:GH3 auxin-responsive promoter family protein [Cytophagaceae bacterium]
MFLINKAIQTYHRGRLKQIDHFRKYPEEVQMQQFKYLLKQAKDTVWGKQHGFASIHSVDDFKLRVPVTDYDGFTPNIIRLRQGEKNLLWRGGIKWFAKSSGTTNSKSKFIPVSNDNLKTCHFRGGHDVLAIYGSLYPNNRLFSGRTLTLGGSHQINNFSSRSKSFYGDLSAILIENIPRWANLFRTPKKKIALISEWEEKLKLITETTIRQNITALTGVPSWFLVLLKHILEHTGKQNILEVWPHMELFIHGGVSFTPYRSQYRELIPSGNMHYMETYNASEGFFGIQDNPATGDMLLMLDYGIFFEFMPLTENGKEFPKTLTIGEVERDTDYALIISTNGGLWRYLIGDTIRFTSIRPYKIIISGRTRHYINAFGEELIIDNAEKALEETCRKTGAIIKEYTAAPVYMSSSSKGTHQWLIEFAKVPDSLSEFTRILDAALQEQNSDYEAKRYKSITLDMPIVVMARLNLFFDWLKKRNKLGGQNKIPRLSNERIYMDDLLKMNTQY